MKRIEDEKIQEKLHDAKELFYTCDFTSTYYYFYMDNKFYMTECNTYNSHILPSLYYNRITLDEFIKGFEKYKKEESHRADFGQKVSETEKMLASLNKKKILESENREERKEVMGKIKNELKVLRKLIVEAQKLGIDIDESKLLEKKIK